MSVVVKEFVQRRLVDFLSEFFSGLVASCSILGKFYLEYIRQGCLPPPHFGHKQCPEELVFFSERSPLGVRPSKHTLRKGLHTLGYLAPIAFLLLTLFSFIFMYLCISVLPRNMFNINNWIYFRYRCTLI